MREIRKKKIESLLKREISSIIMKELKDPRVGLVAINEVSLTNDLRTARVYFTAVGGEKERKAALAGLKNAAGFIRKKAGADIRLRYNPELVFSPDEKAEERQRVLNLLKTIGEEKEDD